MKRLIVPIILLALLVFAIPCWAGELPNLFKPETRVAVDSEIDPWDLFYMEDGRRKTKWITEKVFNCPQGDFDIHIVLTNPVLESKINIIELVVGDGRMLPLGMLCSYSYMKGDEWHMFLYDVDKNRYVRYIGEHGHGGSIFGRNK
jgi:hypothetical protein